MRGMMKNAILVYIFINIFMSVNGANIIINTSSQRLAISPYIYGTNQQMEGDENLTIMRLGGNRMTGLNWETNASNAGSDYQQSSDNYMCGAIEYPLSTTECAFSHCTFNPEFFCANEFDAMDLRSPHPRIHLEHIKPDSSGIVNHTSGPLSSAVLSEFLILYLVIIQ